MSSVADIKSTASGRWVEILPCVGQIDPELLDSKKHPCPKCGGKDRFRMIDSDAGALYCNQCFNKNNGDGLAAIQWLKGCDFPTAVSLAAGYLGIEPNGNGKTEADIVTTMAGIKNVPVDSLIAYGATNGKRGELQVCRVPMYDADMSVTGYLDLAPSPEKFCKGVMMKGCKHGLFVAKRPEPGEAVCIVEGVKDAAALHGIGIPAVGLPTNNMAARFARFFRDVDAIIIPDRDRAGIKGAQQTASRLYGVACSVKIAELPAEFKETGGTDVRDVLRQPDGINKLQNAIRHAKVWTSKPEQTKPKRFQPFPLNALPEPVRSFAAAGAAAIGCDASMIVLPLLSALASAIGNTRRIELKRGWTAPAIIWTVIVGESGTAKSPALRLVMRSIHNRQRRAMKEHATAMEQYEVDLAFYEKALAEWKRDKKSGQLPPVKPLQPEAERCVVVDTTVEALAPLLLANSRGLFLARDELAGWFGSFDRYNSGNGGSDESHWLSMYNAESMTIDRKTGRPRTIVVPSASISITGGIQPGILHRALGDKHRESGLASRLLLTCPPRKPKRWTESDIDPQAEADLATLLDRLYELRPAIDNQGEPCPLVVTLTPKAKAVWISFFKDHATEQSALSGDLAAAFSKLEETAARLALIIHCTRSAANDPTLQCDSKVDAVSMLSGIAMTEWFKNEVRRVYELLSESGEETQLRQLLDWIERHGGSVTVRDLQRGPRQYREKSDAETALNELVKAGLGRWETDDSGGKGRPVGRFVLAVSEELTSGDGDTNSQIHAKTGNCVTVASADTPKNAIPNFGDWGVI